MSETTETGVILAPRDRRRRRERGQSLVEFALVIPLFLVLLFGIIDFGLGLKSWIAITNSARESARYAAIGCAGGAIDSTAVIERAKTTATGLTEDRVNVAVENCDAGSAAESVIVTVSYDYDMITPLGGLLGMIGSGSVDSTITLTSVADMRME